MGNRKNRRRGAGNPPAPRTRRCVVVGCDLSSRTAPGTISFHAFPKSTLAWVQTQCLAHLPADVDLAKACICSRHYDPSFINTSRVPPFRRLLASNAIPTIFTGGDHQPPSPAPVLPTDRSSDIDDPDTPDSDASFVALADETAKVMVIPPFITKPVSPIVSENESTSEEDTADGTAATAVVEQAITRVKRKSTQMSVSRKHVLATLVGSVTERAPPIDIVEEEENEEARFRLDMQANQSGRHIDLTSPQQALVEFHYAKTDSLPVVEEVAPANTSIDDMLATLALVKAQCDRVTEITSEIGDQLPVKLRNAIGRLTATVNSVRWHDPPNTDTGISTTSSSVKPQIEIYHSGIVVVEGGQSPTDCPSPANVRHLLNVCEEETSEHEEQQLVHNSGTSLPARIIETTNHLRDGIRYRIHKVL